jgi:hypothetical protein
MAYWLARIFAAMGLIAPFTFVLAMAASAFVPDLGKTLGGPHETIAMSIAGISILAIFLAAMGASFTILLGWSADRRKLKRLELELEYAKSAAKISS